MEYPLLYKVKITQLFDIFSAFKITLKEISIKTKISSGTLSKYKNFNRPVPLKNLMKICEALNIDFKFEPKNKFRI